MYGCVDALASEPQPHNIYNTTVASNVPYINLDAITVILSRVGEHIGQSIDFLQFSHVKKAVFFIDSMCGISNRLKG